MAEIVKSIKSVDGTRVAKIFLREDGNYEITWIEKRFDEGEGVEYFVEVKGATHGLFGDLQIAIDNAKNLLELV